MAASESRAAAGERANDKPTLGQTLKQARTAQGLSLEQLATELRIEERQLLALEQDQLERIGVPVFIKGYIRQYGQRLGLDTRDLLLRYYEQVGGTMEIEVQPSRTIKLRDERQITVWIVAGIVLAVLAVFLAVWWLNGAALS
jgi:cytoskeleton protein RodZ